ncbi:MULTISPECIES: hypothetical protein [Pantoea]|uniref:hypothetical protein n=1 Tax=Pantoea TaxID=53335 RepID=UPI00257C5840|nr:MULTISPECIES: hypothetical protein [Pantoea]MDU5473399.1 hypothetical protein [Pantoea sp.]
MPDLIKFPGFNPEEMVAKARLTVANINDKRILSALNMRAMEMTAQGHDVRIEVKSDGSTDVTVELMELKPHAGISEAKSGSGLSYAAGLDVIKRALKAATL